MIPYPHQVEIAKQAYTVLKNNMMVYLAMEERTGKTLTAILAAELCDIKTVLVITKKKAIEGWEDTLAKFKHTKSYSVTNYHQACKFANRYDLVILDESHNYISSYPKRGKLWEDVKRLTLSRPIIYISATPYAQGPQQLYHQFKLSSWSPWNAHMTFYRWFDTYGKPYKLRIAGIEVPQYDKVHFDKILKDCEHLFISKTRTELGFEHEPEDKLHYIDLSDETRRIYNELLTDNICENPLIVCDTNSKLRTTLHQLEGGTIKDLGVLANDEKLDYIHSTFGDVNTLVIMYNYKLEYDKLAARFKRALLLQATSYAEGIDLHEYDNLVVYSQDFSTARHTQRRARQCNLKRSSPITVHYLLVKKAISDQVYKTVSINKKNFVDSVFTKEIL